MEIELTMDEMDLTAAERKASYEEIKAYVLEKFGMKVSNLYIAQVKQKCGIIVNGRYRLQSIVNLWSMRSWFLTATWNGM